MCTNESGNYRSDPRVAAERPNGIHAIAGGSGSQSGVPNDAGNGSADELGRSDRAGQGVTVDRNRRGLRRHDSSSGRGTPTATSIEDTELPATVLETAKELRDAVAQRELSGRQRAQLDRFLAAILKPTHRPGRKPSARVGEAHRDFAAGMRGIPLFRKHIPNFEKLSRWRRRIEQRRLMDAIHKRASRARQKQSGRSE